MTENPDPAIESERCQILGNFCRAHWNQGTDIPAGGMERHQSLAIQIST